MRIKIRVFLFFPIFLLGLVNCAYFNTYYNAETAYEEAHKAHKKVLQNFPDSLLVEAPADAKAKYDRAIEKATKLLDVYPKDKKWHDDAIYLAGRSYYYKKDFTRAIKRLRELQREFPSSPFIPESFIYLAKSYIEEDELSKAEETLGLALDRYPHLDNDQQISLLLIEIAIRREGRAQAITIIENMQKKIKSETRKVELMLRTAELYMSMNRYDKALNTLKKIPRNKEFPVILYRIDKNILTCLSTLDSIDAALKHTSNMLREKLYKNYYREIKFERANLLYKLGKTKDAEDIYRELVSGADSNSVKIDSADVKSKANYKLGLLYQKEKENYKDSKDYYDKAVNAKDTAIANSALKRVRAMSRIEKLRTKPENQDTLLSKYERQFTIAELFRYDLNEPDSAYFYFLKLSKDTSDTAHSPAQALCQAGVLARYELKNEKAADSIFQLVISKYQSTDYARLAWRETNKQKNFLTYKESADSAFKKAEYTYFVENDVKQAVQLYYDIARDYPDLEIAPKSLFVAAWLADNVLQKNKVAKQLYERICEKYAQSMYCTKEAKPRIKTLLDTLEAMQKAAIARNTSKKQNDPKVKNSTTPSDSSDHLLKEFTDSLTNQKQPSTLGKDTIKTTSEQNMLPQHTTDTTTNIKMNDTTLHKETSIMKKDSIINQ